MTTHDRLEVRQWMLDYRSDDDLVPLRIEITNWTKWPGEAWSADIAVRYDGHPPVSAELIIRTVADGFLVDVHGPHIQSWVGVHFPTWHAAQLAAEQYALNVVHLIPIDA